MAIVVERTSPKVDSSGASGTSFFTGTPTVGSRIIVAAHGYAGQEQTLTVTDDATGGSNTYAVDKHQYGGAGSGADVASGAVSRTKSGLGVTAAYDVGFICFAAVEVSGLVDAAPIDVAVSSATDQTSPFEISSGALAQADEFVICAFQYGANSLNNHGIALGTWTNATPSLLYVNDGTAINSEYGAAGYAVVSNAAGVTARFTSTVTPSAYVSPLVLVSYKAAAAGGSGATVNGQLLSAAAGLIAGAASSGSTIDGQLLSVVSSLIAGAAGAGAAVDGQLLSSVASLISGALSAGSTVDGQVLVALASAVAGSASSGSTVDGQLLQAVASLIAGSASIGETVPGQTLTVLSSLISGAASAGSTVEGQVLATTVSIIAGAVGAGSVVDGQTLAAAASLIAGNVDVGQTIPGQVLPLLASLVAGEAAAGSTVDGQVISALASLLAGSASADSGATVSGQTLQAIASLIAGAAIGDQVAAGDWQITSRRRRR